MATLLHTGASPGLGQAPCLGRKGGSRAGQDAVLRPTKEAAFPAEHGVASGSPQRDEPRAQCSVPAPAWLRDEDGMISLHVLLSFTNVSHCFMSCWNFSLSAPSQDLGK